MKAREIKLTEEEKEKFIVLYTNHIKRDFDKLSDYFETPPVFNGDDGIIDLYLSHKKEIVSISKIEVEKNNIIRTFFNVFSFTEEEDSESFFLFKEIYEMIDDYLVNMSIGEDINLTF